MGEIADALKRADAERESRGDDRRRPSSAAASDPFASLGSQASDQRAVAPWPHDAAAEELRDPPGASAGPSLEHTLSHVDVHRHLALRIVSELERRSQKCVAMVSALRGEGKTTASCNLATALASLTAQRNVALVDLDLRKPSVARRLGLTPARGIEEVLLGQASLDEVRIPCVHPPLDVYPVRVPQREAHQLLVTPAFARMIHQLESRYTTVIVDTPPTLLVPDSTLILRVVKACVAIASVGETRVRRFEEMLGLLPAGQMLGKILNRAPAPRHTRGAYYQYGVDEPS